MALRKIATFCAPVTAGEYYRLNLIGPAVPEAVVTAAWHSEEKEAGPAIKIVYLPGSNSGWEAALPVAKGAREVRVTLYFSDNLLPGDPKDYRFEIATITAPPPRHVRIASGHMRVPENGDWKANRDVMIALIQAAGEKKVDLLCLSENFLERQSNGAGSDQSFVLGSPELAPIFEACHRAKVHLVFSFHERTTEGKVYNTAVLIGPEGTLLGSYRKTHLTLHERVNGLNEGTDFPVFETALGKIGILICWDAWFPESALALAQAGAEIICFPVAGCGVENQWRHAWRARAMDNQVFWLASITDNCGGAAPSQIIAPNGDLLSSTRESNSLAVADVQLPINDEIYWLSVGPSHAEWRNVIQHSRVLKVSRSVLQ